MSGRRRPRLGLSVRPAVAADLEDVRQIGHRTWWATYAAIAGDDYVRMGLAKWWTPEQLLPAIERGSTQLAEISDGDDTLVVGMADAWPMGEHVVLWKLYVLPGYQGIGAGTMLLEAVLRRARAGGHVDLRVPVVDGNEAALRFYLSHGFGEVSRERNGSGVPDSIWLQRSLTVTPSG